MVVQRASRSCVGVSAGLESLALEGEIVPAERNTCTTQHLRSRMRPGANDHHQRVVLEGCVHCREQGGMDRVFYAVLPWWGTNRRHPARDRKTHRLPESPTKQHLVHDTVPRAS